MCEKKWLLVHQPMIIIKILNSVLPPSVKIDEHENTHSEQALPVQVFSIGKLPLGGSGTYQKQSGL